MWLNSFVIYPIRIRTKRNWLKSCWLNYLIWDSFLQLILWNDVIISLHHRFAVDDLRLYLFMKKCVKIFLKLLNLLNKDTFVLVLNSSPILDFLLPDLWVIWLHGQMLQRFASMLKVTTIFVMTLKNEMMDYISDFVNMFVEFYSFFLW